MPKTISIAEGAVRRQIKHPPPRLWIQFIYCYITAVLVRSEYEQGQTDEQQLIRAARNLYYANELLTAPMGGIPPVVLEDTLLLALWRDEED